TQQHGNELDYGVGTPPTNGVVHTMVLQGGSSDHFPVGFGPLRAAAEPTPLFSSPRAVESMQSGGVLDAFRGGTADFTPIDSFARNRVFNQSWSILGYDDGSWAFQQGSSGRGAALNPRARDATSGKCIDITHSDQHPGAGRALSLFSCNDGDSQRWIPEYLGNSEYQFHSKLLPSLCMNIRGGQSDPTAAADIIVWPSPGTPTQRSL